MDGMNGEFLKIGKAAALLACHPNTLRILDAKGIIKSCRNYLGYRVFAIEDVMRLKADRERVVEREDLIPRCQTRLKCREA